MMSAGVNAGAGTDISRAKASAASGCWLIACGAWMFRFGVSSFISSCSGDLFMTGTSGHGPRVTPEWLHHQPARRFVFDPGCSPIRIVKLREMGDRAD